VAVRSVDRLRVTAVYEPDENGWINARVLEIPGINTCAPTEDEARTMLADAAREFVAALADLADRDATGATRYEPLEIDLG
jgi:predicted RNase H-like HicB family nuclease